MKRSLFKLTIAVIALVLLGALLVSCGKKEEGSEQSSESQESTSETYFEFFYSDEGYVCTFVLPKDVTSGEREVAVEFKNALKKKTGRDLLMLKEGDEKIDTSKNLVLIGKNEFEESKAVYSTLQPRQAVAKISGNKFVLAFDSVSSGKKMVESIMAVLSECDKTDVKISSAWTATLTAKPDSEDLPIYEKSGTKTTDLERESKLITSAYNTLEQFNAYCDKISAAGFDKVNTKESNGHKFVTFMGEHDYVYAYYVKDHGDASGVGDIKVVTGPQESFAMGDFSDGLDEKYEPNVTIIGMNKNYNNGQGYVFRLPDGRFIIHDGGIHENADDILDALKAQAPDPNNIVIAAWFVSHPHGDHQWALEQFLQNQYGLDNVKIERAIFNYAAANAYKIKDDDNAVTVSNMYAKLSELSPSTQVIKAHTGQDFKFGSVNVEILYTIEDYLPGNLDYLNSSSMVIRVNIAGQKILLLGDTTTRSGPILESMWGAYLKSDVVQLAHHGIWPSNASLYTKVQADVLLWPTQAYCARSMLGESYGTVIEKALSYAEDVYVSNDTITVVQLPFVIKNNKKGVLAEIQTALAPGETE